MERGTPLPRYFPLQQFILDVDISSTSKILFALLLNRADLSQKNVWEDDDGFVYCVYTIEDMEKDMNMDYEGVEVPDYYGEDGLLHCGVCHETKETYLPEGKEWLGRTTHSDSCSWIRMECRK